MIRLMQRITMISSQGRTLRRIALGSRAFDDPLFIIHRTITTFAISPTTANAKKPASAI